MFNGKHPHSGKVGRSFEVFTKKGQVISSNAYYRLPSKAGWKEATAVLSIEPGAFEGDGPGNFKWKGTVAIDPENEEAKRDAQLQGKPLKETTIEVTVVAQRTISTTYNMFSL